MHRIRSLAPLLLLFPGCAEWDNLESPFEADPDRAGCLAIDGTFAAESLAFTAIDDPGLVEDFGGVPDFTTDLDFDQQLFTSTLVVDGEVLTTSGGFEVFEDEIVFTDPFIPGMSDDIIVLDCTFADDALVLDGDVGFDFDDEVDAFVDTTFAGALTPIF